MGSTRYLVIGYLRKDIVRIHNIRNYYSIILMDIRRVKPDKDCYTLAVPLSILPGLNADFDGDEEKCLLTSLIAGIAFISQSAAKTFCKVQRLSNR